MESVNVAPLARAAGHSPMDWSRGAPRRARGPALHPRMGHKMNGFHITEGKG